MDLSGSGELIVSFEHLSSGLGPEIFLLLGGVGRQGDELVEAEKEVNRMRLGRKVLTRLHQIVDEGGSRTWQGKG